jgi:hypothetical protein
MNTEGPKPIKVNVAANLWHASEDLTQRLEQLKIQVTTISSMLDKRLLAKGGPVPAEAPSKAQTSIERQGLIPDLESFNRSQHQLLDKIFDRLDAIQEILD